MKQCTLDHFSDCLSLWTAQDYIRCLRIDARGRVTITFMDGVKDTFHVRGCDRGQVIRACRFLAERGIPVQER